MPNRRGGQATWREKLINMPRYPKRVLLMANDFLILLVSLWAGYALRLSTFYVPETWPFAMLLLSAPVIGIVVFYQLGLYRLVTRYIGPKGAVRIFIAVTLAIMIWSLVIMMTRIDGVIPRTSIVIFWFMSGALVWASRQVAGLILRGVPYATRAHFDSPRKNVVIYGAGPTGVQLLQSLRESPDYNPVAFIDENKNMKGQMVAGLKVYRPLKIGKLVQRENIKEVLLAIPEATRRRRRTIIKRLEVYNVAVKTLPAMHDIATGKVSVHDLRAISADDLLGRDAVPADPALLARNIQGKSVLVTGAGGTIGSELTRQIMRLHPSRLVLLDVSEAALYVIKNELTGGDDESGALAGEPHDRVLVVSVLGSVTDESLVRRTISQYGIRTIYHAAAYKHVPIVELNPMAGLKNNTFGTRVLAEAARDLGVEHFVLVSTDKAVRPTNIMGASKRLAELVLQAEAAKRDCATVFTMVRFGNVLDSSGSVVQKFRQQISAGGPVTVTHPEINRYFMSIPEAAELVIQAGAMAKGGEVFVLDMGKPVKINDLARSMIRQMGLTVRDEQHPNGDIAIVYTGLRHGEKLYEELLIGENTTSTPHPRILRSWEPSRDAADLERDLEALLQAISTGNVEAIHAVLKRAVEGYTPETRHLQMLEAGAAENAPQSGRVLH